MLDNIAWMILITTIIGIVYQDTRIIIKNRLFCVIFAILFPIIIWPIMFAALVSKRRI